MRNINYFYLGINYSVVFIKEINVIHLFSASAATDVFPENLWIFQNQPPEVFYEKSCF